MPTDGGTSLFSYPNKIVFVGFYYNDKGINSYFSNFLRSKDVEAKRNSVEDISVISAGFFHSFALASSGNIFGFGSNE